MPKNSKKSINKKIKPTKLAKQVKLAKPAKPAKRVKPAKLAKPVKQTLVWKSSKRGPKKRVVKPAVAVKTLPSHDRQDSLQEELISQSKFQLGPKENAGQFQAHNLPFDYGLNRIILLVVDPTFVFTYWEVQTDKMHTAIEKIGGDAKLTLRFFDLEKSTSWDVSIYERVGSWYLRLSHAGQKILVEIGMKNGRGDFCSLARSNTMIMPPTGLARPGPTKWMLVGHSGERIITEIEEYTDADLELLRKIMGPYFFDLLKRGKFTGLAGSSLENVFIDISGIMPPSISS